MMFRSPGSRIIVEDELRVAKFYRILEPGDSGRGIRESERNSRRRLVQFFAVNGGMRTICLDDIVDIK